MKSVTISYKKFEKLVEVKNIYYFCRNNHKEKKT